MGKRGKNDRLDRNDDVVAKNLRFFRLARRMSQTELGLEIGVTFQQIQKYEKGTNALSPGRLRKACAVLQVTPADMFGAPPTLDGKPVPIMSRWAYRTLAALNEIKSERLKRAVGALIEEFVGDAL